MHAARSSQPPRTRAPPSLAVLLLLLLSVLAAATPVQQQPQPQQRQQHQQQRAQHAPARAQQAAAAAAAARYAEWDGPPPPNARTAFQRIARLQRVSATTPELEHLKRATQDHLRTRQTPHLPDDELPPLHVPDEITQSSSLVSCIYNLGIRIVTPISTEFWTSAQSDNLNYHYLPLAVVYPNNTRQVSHAVRCAVKHGNIPVTARSGGHSFSGSGSGGQDGALVIDLATLDSITLDTARGMHDAYIGPGARLGDVVKALWSQGRRGMTHGTCPTVGVGGHALCGGFGPLSRAWGLAADAILQLDVVLADGSFALVNPANHPDLMWGMRGAGHHFAIVTRFTFRTQDVANKTMTFALHTWHDNIAGPHDFAKLVDGIHAWSSRKDFPAELGYHLQITPGINNRDGHGNVIIQMRANYMGPKAAAEMVYSTLWPELKARGGDKLATPDAGSHMREMNWLEMMGEWDDFGAPGDKLNTAKERLEHNNYVPKTTLVRNNPAAPPSSGPSVGAQVPLAAWEKWASVLYEGAAHGVGSNRWSWNVFMEMFGGHNAFHLRADVRKRSSIPFLDGMWLVQQTVGTWPGSVVDPEGKRWVARMATALDGALDEAKIARSSYGCYQDPDRRDWLEAYHGTGEARDHLFFLKDKYDPTNLFRDGQSLGSTAERAAKKADAAAAAAAAPPSKEGHWSHDVHPLPR